MHFYLDHIVPTPPCAFSFKPSSTASSIGTTSLSHSWVPQMQSISLALLGHGSRETCGSHPERPLGMREECQIMRSGIRSRSICSLTRAPIA
ncbi:hypothetical protein M408DRAFT_197737 [Serendipita vermifera MAFF 305830]|uniref:Uncharacterized protein n=1 Tax=Serendipita vermifera MAFF 305830 TaxID=933852 RepID=A0A0C3AHR8_SERVB|nr:hypothetical protein M408DRAFT_197737 [Serendipita vermifera MAFF 305830]